jgi:hypothetical protein
MQVGDPVTIPLDHRRIGERWEAVSPHTSREPELGSGESGQVHAASATGKAVAVTPSGVLLGIRRSARRDYSTKEHRHADPGDHIHASTEAQLRPAGSALQLGRSIVGPVGIQLRC